MWAYVALTFVASMLLAGRMAGARRRSIKAWVWVAAVVGPLGPLTLYLLGNNDGDPSPPRRSKGLIANVLARLRKYRHRLPAGFKFDREEASVR
jgi:hypothetical protein